MMYLPLHEQYHDTAVKSTTHSFPIHYVVRLNGALDNELVSTRGHWQPESVVRRYGQLVHHVNWNK